MYKTFSADLERKFDEAYRKANLACSKAELLARNNRPNKHGSLRRPKNAFFIYAKEYRKRIEVGLYNSTTTQSREIVRNAGQAWRRLSEDEKLVYRLAASVVEKKFYEDNPGYVYRPKKSDQSLKIIAYQPTTEADVPQDQGEFAEVFESLLDLDIRNISDPADAIYSMTVWNGFSWNGP